MEHIGDEIRNACDNKEESKKGGDNTQVMPIISQHLQTRLDGEGDVKEIANSPEHMGKNTDYLVACNSKETLTTSTKDDKLEATPSTLIAEAGSSFESENENIGDGPEIKNEFTEEEFIRAHPEGSFMAFLIDKSEENVEALIKNNSKSEMMSYGFRLNTILPEIREKIWKMLRYSDISNIRATCKLFREEIDSEIGIQLYFVDNEEESLRLAITTVIQRLVIVHMEMSSLCKLIPHNPHKLKDLSIRGCVSPDAVHEILLRCSNIEILEIEHSSEWAESYSLEALERLETDANTWGSLKDWMFGNLFKSEDEIRYVYGCFKRLRKIQFYTSDDASPRTQNLVEYGLFPILNCVHSNNLTILNIKVFVTPKESKLLTDSLFKIFLQSRNLKEVRVQHYRSDSYTFEPLPNADLERKTKTGHGPGPLTFSEYRPMPQFNVLYLEMPEYCSSYYDWVFLLKNQHQLRRLKWDVGGNYWLYPIQSIQASSKTLENLTLRKIRCYTIEGNLANQPELLSLGNFHELIAIKYFHLVGMELHTSQFCRTDLLPKTIENLQIECFQITPDQLFTIHSTLLSLKFLSLNHWNISWENFVESLKVIGKIIQNHSGKYRVLTFLEKSMYSTAEELLEINRILKTIKEVSIDNAMNVDEVSGDNGIGFVLVVGENRVAESESKNQEQA